MRRLPNTVLLLIGLVIVPGPAAATSCLNRAPTEPRCSKAERKQEIRKIVRERQQAQQKRTEEQLLRTAEERRRRELGCPRALLNCP